MNKSTNKRITKWYWLLCVEWNAANAIYAWWKGRIEFSDVNEIFSLSSVREKERKIYDYDFPADGLYWFILFLAYFGYDLLLVVLVLHACIRFPTAKRADSIFDPQTDFSSVFHKTLFIFVDIMRFVKLSTRTACDWCSDANKQQKWQACEVLNRHRLNLRHLNINQSAFHRVVVLLHTHSTQANRTV